MYVKCIVPETEIEYSLILPEQWDDEEFEERFDCYYNEETDLVTVIFYAPNGDEIYHEDFEIADWEDEMHDFSDIDDLID